jgi:hypothetical protein
VPLRACIKFITKFPSNAKFNINPLSSFGDKKIEKGWTQPLPSAIA